MTGKRQYADRASVRSDESRTLCGSIQAAVASVASVAWQGATFQPASGTFTSRFACEAVRITLADRSAPDTSS